MASGKGTSAGNYLVGEIAVEQGGKVVHRKVKVPERAWEFGHLAQEKANKVAHDHKVERYLERPELLIGNLPRAPKGIGDPTIPQITPANQQLDVLLMWNGRRVFSRRFDMKAKKAVTIGNSDKADFAVPESIVNDDAFALFSGSGADAVLNIPNGMTAMVYASKTDAGNKVSNGYQLKPGEHVVVTAGDLAFRGALCAGETTPSSGAMARTDYSLLAMFFGALLLMLIGVALIVMFAPPLMEASDEDVQKAKNRLANIVVKEEKKKEEAPKLENKGPSNAPVDSKIKQNEKRPPDKQKVLSSGVLGALTQAAAVDNVFGGAGLGVGINSALSGLTGQRIGGGDALGGLGARGAGAGGAGGVVGIGGMGLGGPGGKGGVGKISLAGSGKAQTQIIPGKVVTKGGLDREVIAAVIRKNQRQIKYCYEKELSKDPNLYGKIVVFFVIDAAGGVQTAQIAETEMNSEPVESCMLRNIKRWKFPTPKGGGVVEVRYPWVFKAS